MNAGETGSLRDEALEAVRGAFARLAAEEAEKGTAVDAGEELVEAVFDAAWNHQFDETPAALRRRVKALLKDAGGEAS